MTIYRITTSIAGVEHIGIERGHQAIAALRHIGGQGLRVIKSRGTFQPIHEYDVVPILPCSTCKDGGLRVVGRVRKIGRAHV